MRGAGVSGGAWGAGWLCAAFADSIGVVGSGGGLTAARRPAWCESTARGAGAQRVARGGMRAARAGWYGWRGKGRAGSEGGRGR